MLNFGSLNIDHIYRVPHLVRPGETLKSTGYSVMPGGKGLNQSVAVARAGGAVGHVGKIGRDGNWLLDEMTREGIDTTHVRVGDEPTGHAIVQVDDSGENAIVTCAGANRAILRRDIEDTLTNCGTDAVILVQNEINDVDHIIRTATGRGLHVVFNPGPFDDAVRDYPLELVSTLVVNETEARAIAGTGGGTGDRDDAYDGLGTRLAARLPDTDVIVTLGSRGVVCKTGGTTIHVSAYPARAIDTTGAGDTFIGYYIARRTAGDNIERALRVANKAAALAVTRPGAMPSIPGLDDISI